MRRSLKPAAPVVPPVYRPGVDVHRPSARVLPARSAAVQRKLHPSLQGEDAKLRLRYLLGRAQGLGKPLDESRWEKIADEKNPELWDWAKVVATYGGDFATGSNLASTGTRRVTCYRADGRSPEKLKGSNPPGFGVRATVRFGLHKAVLLTNGELLAEAHV